MLSVIIAVIVKHLQSGGSAFSHLDKTIELPIDKINLDFFMRGFRRRLSSIGFQPSGGENNFTQGGPDLTQFGAASHARTKKILTLRCQESGTDTVTACLTLRYLGLVVVDTGESAYRDAVLDFISGDKDEMTAVPTESLLALNSLVGGVVACASWRFSWSFRTIWVCGPPSRALA